ncbi:MAG TPA: ankyrin repeat domain-containing protein [Candidatus Megaira endosymbiont of Hartmannula sinica]|nr:ankyrin repeat domain-containing protein [Candidatus Megaera endosymbiont of Hartmannula sinica]
MSESIETNRDQENIVSLPKGFEDMRSDVYNDDKNNSSIIDNIQTSKKDTVDNIQTSNSNLSKKDTVTTASDDGSGSNITSKSEKYLENKNKNRDITDLVVDDSKNTSLKLEDNNIEGNTNIDSFLGDEKNSITTTNTNNRAINISNDSLLSNNLNKENIKNTGSSTNTSDNQFIQDEIYYLNKEFEKEVGGGLSLSLKNMSMDKYIELFNKSLKSNYNRKQNFSTNNFIKNYYNNFKTYNIYYSDDFSNSNVTKKQIYDLAASYIKNGDAYSLFSLIDNSENIILLVDEDGNNLLHLSIYYNNYNIAKFLIQRGININQPNYKGITPINLAQYSNNHSINSLINSAVF